MPGTRVDAARVPVALYFVAGAIAQYVGAAFAVLLFDRVHPAGVTLLRCGGAAAILWAWRRPRLSTFDRATLKAAVVFGLITTAMNLCFYLAADALPLGNAVAIEFLGPIAVAALGARNARNLGALALALVGVALLADVEMEANLAGVLWALGAAVFWAGYIIYGKRVADGDGAGLDGLAIGLAAGTLALIPFTIGSVATASGLGFVLAAGAAVAVLSSVIPYALDQIVFVRLSQDHFAFLLALLPVTAVAVGAVLLAQLPSARELLAIGLVVVAVAVRSERVGSAGREPDPA